MRLRICLWAPTMGPRSTQAGRPWSLARTAAALTRAPLLALVLWSSARPCPLGPRDEGQPGSQVS